MSASNRCTKAVRALSNGGYYDNGRGYEIRSWEKLAGTVGEKTKGMLKSVVLKLECMSASLRGVGRSC